MLECKLLLMFIGLREVLEVLSEQSEDRSDPRISCLEKLRASIAATRPRPRDKY